MVFRASLEGMCCATLATVLDRDVHNGVDVIFGVDDMPLLKQEVVGRKCGLGENSRSHEK